MTWWKSKQIRFECIPDCGKCCETPAGFAGAVWFSVIDTMNLPRRAFKRIVERLQDDGEGYLYLPTFTDNECTFYKDTKCEVHVNKPKPCTHYPFWPSIMESEDRWLRESEHCPGIGKGPEVSRGYISKCLGELKNYPELERE